VAPDERPAWVGAAGRLDELQRAAAAAALLRSAHRAGVLRALAAGPVEEGPLAERLGLTGSRLAAALQLLAAHGVTEAGPDGWTLAAGWAELVTGATPFEFSGVLGLGRVWTEQFGAALERGEDYWELEPADRLEVATGISPDPRSAATIAMARGEATTLAGVVESLEAGGRVLELGCGLASRLCALLQAFPQARAVGVELDAALVDAARTRAAELGVQDRVELVVGDATAYDGEGRFVLANWSQFFFPEPSRAGTLAAALRALEPGGWVRTPVVWTGEAPPPGSPEDQELAEMRLVLDLWGVPMRTVAEVSAELSAAGFVDVHDRQAPGFHVVLGRRPD
jgi:SAM-dependent methyltransferase